MIIRSLTKFKINRNFLQTFRKECFMCMVSLQLNLSWAGQCEKQVCVLFNNPAVSRWSDLLASFGYLAEMTLLHTCLNWLAALLKSSNGTDSREEGDRMTMSSSPPNNSEVLNQVCLRLIMDVQANWKCTQKLAQFLSWDKADKSTKRKVQEINKAEQVLKGLSEVYMCF